MKFTTKQKIIFDTLDKFNKPLSAENLFEMLDEGTMNLSTIYRTLEKFYHEGLVSRNYLDNTAYYYLTKDEHHHYMICEICKKKYEMDCHIDEVILKIQEEYGFKVSHHDLNFYGVCKNCQ